MNLMYSQDYLNLDATKLACCRPLRDDEVLPVRQHRIVPSAAMAIEEGEQEVSDLSVYLVFVLSREFLFSQPKKKEKQRKKKKKVHCRLNSFISEFIFADYCKFSYELTPYRTH